VLREGAGGPFSRIDFPGALGSLASGIDDRGRIVGIYANPDTLPSAQRPAMNLAGALSEPMAPPAARVLGGPR
jgi:hypothetical protein